MSQLLIIKGFVVMGVKRDCIVKVRVSLAGDVTSELDYAYVCHWLTATHQACSLKAVWGPGWLAGAAAAAAAQLAHTANKSYTIFGDTNSNYYCELIFSTVGKDAYCFLILPM